MLYATTRPDSSEALPQSAKGPLTWFFTWWRGQDLNLRPSGYERDGHRPRWYAPGRISPVQAQFGQSTGRRSSALVGTRWFPSCCTPVVRAGRRNRQSESLPSSHEPESCRYTSLVTRPGEPFHLARRSVCPGPIDRHRLPTRPVERHCRGRGTPGFCMRLRSPSRGRGRQSIGRHRREREPSGRAVASSRILWQ